jgi:1,4-dihydroxy-2-naphthoate octaprenyltransferase
MIIFDYSTWWSILAFLSIPKAIQAVKRFVGKTKPIEMMPAMKATSQTNTLLGFLLAAGLLISTIISQ